MGHSGNLIVTPRISTVFSLKCFINSHLGMLVLHKNLNNSFNDYRYSLPVIVG
jgi:hypothetical protein